jgi:phosphatidate cytidylyltransferase
MLASVQSFLEDRATLYVVVIILAILVINTAAVLLIRLVRPEWKIGNFAARVRSWWWMVLIFFAATLLNRTVTYLAIGLLSFYAFRELYSILDFRLEDRWAVFLAYCAIPIQYYLAYIGWYRFFIIFIPFTMFLVLPFVLVIRGESKGIIKSMASLQWILMLTVFGISHMAFLLSLPPFPQNDVSKRGLLLFLVFITEINDVFQYFAGKALGRRKILPSISPNKTWEGFVGGIVLSLTAGWFLGFLTPFTGWRLLLVTFMIAFSGFGGDVVMSAVKRDIGLKDTGTAIPGHGGILDRIDSLAFTAPVFLHLVRYLNYP